MVDIVPNSQEIIGHGSFSIVYKARLKDVSKIYKENLIGKYKQFEATIFDVLHR